jgi:hypothetical protein
MNADSKSAPPLRAVGGALARYLSQPRHVHGASAPVELVALAGMLRPADVLLVEGNSRLSTAVKYLTQSTWSHAAQYVGDRLGTRDAQGSGDPTRAICSTLVVWPSSRCATRSCRWSSSARPMCPACMDEIYHVRHHSLFAPRDFDVSPYFAVVKPTLVAGFDHHALRWADLPLSQGAAR